MKDEVLERIFAHQEMQTIPLGAQSTAVKAISEVLEQIEAQKNQKRQNFTQEYLMMFQGSLKVCEKKQNLKLLDLQICCKQI